MRAIAFHEFGGPEVLRLEPSWPEPVPEPDEVLVRVRSIAVNRNTEIALRDGTGPGRPTLPHIPGIAPAGEIVEIGAEVRDVAVGDRVVVYPGIACRTCPDCLAGRTGSCSRGGMFGITRHGGYAELATAPAANAMALPEGLSLEQAAAGVSIFPTGWHLLIHRAQVRPGESVLVLAAGGALGIAGVQIAKRAGATVIAAASADWKLDRARALGADHGVNYGTTALGDAVLELTGGRGVDVVYDNVSAPDLFTEAITSLAASGRLVCSGSHGGGLVEVDMTRVYRRRLSILGTNGGTYADVERTLRLAAAGELTMPIHATFPLAEAAAAQELVTSRDIFGRVMLAV